MLKVRRAAVPTLEEAVSPRVSPAVAFIGVATIVCQVCGLKLMIKRCPTFVNWVIEIFGMMALTPRVWSRGS